MGGHGAVLGVGSGATGEGRAPVIAPAQDHKREAMESALARAASEAATQDLAAACRRLALSAPLPDGGLRVHYLDRVLHFAGGTLRCSLGDGRPAHLVDALVVLKTLGSGAAGALSGRWIAYRDFPGGQFYEDVFRRRVTTPMAHAIGGVADLRERLVRYRWTTMSGGGDLNARVQVFGNVFLGLTYTAADELGPARCDVIFDAAVRRILDAEMALALAARTCLGLYPHPCARCNPCGYCEGNA